MKKKKSQAIQAAIEIKGALEEILGKPIPIIAVHPTVEGVKQIQKYFDKAVEDLESQRTLANTKKKN